MSVARFSDMVISLPDPDAPAPRRGGLVKVAEVPTWRRLSLLAIGIAVAMFHLYPGLSLGEVLIAGSAPLAPPMPLGAIALVAMLAYALYQNAESQRFIRVYDRASRSLVAIAVLSCMQQVTAGRSLYLATASCFLLVILAASAYLRVHSEIAANRAPRWIGVPFALMVGYFAFVLIGALDVSITMAGCPSSAPTIALPLALAGITIALALRASDAALPTLIAWLVTSIPAAHRGITNVQGAALLAGAICVAIAVLIVATRVAAPSGHPARR
jgi:hypothetical protein